MHLNLNVNVTPTTLHAADGYPLTALRYTPDRRVRAHLVVAGATAVPGRSGSTMVKPTMSTKTVIIRIESCFNVPDCMGPRQRAASSPCPQTRNAAALATMRRTPEAAAIPRSWSGPSSDRS